VVLVGMDGGVCFERLSDGPVKGRFAGAQGR
jgi:hypothetical protein